MESGRLCPHSFETTTESTEHTEAFDLFVKSFPTLFASHLSVCSVSSVVVYLCLFISCMPASAADTKPFKPVVCEGSYPRHLQGICTNGKDALYWSWTTTIVKTDTDGHILKKVPAPSHQGDLCFHDGRLYVAVNLGKFNAPAGKADSWVYVYDGETLDLLSKHAVPDLVHGAGGMAFHDGHFIIIGGLPPGTPENYVYLYNTDFKLLKKHVLASGYTLMGIQTIEHADGAWWFGCYGQPQVLLRADENFKFTGRWEFPAAVGMASVASNQVLVAENTVAKDRSNNARIRLARIEENKGRVWMK